jgi:cell division protein FtsW (lipid II flippase)
LAETVGEAILSVAAARFIIVAPISPPPFKIDRINSFVNTEQHTKSELEVIQQK